MGVLKIASRNRIISQLRIRGNKKDGGLSILP